MDREIVRLKLSMKIPREVVDWLSTKNEVISWGARNIIIEQFNKETGGNYDISTNWSKEEKD